MFLYQTEVKQIISVDLEHTSPDLTDEGVARFTKIGPPPWSQHQDWVKKDDGTIDNERPASNAGQLLLPEPKPAAAPAPPPGPAGPNIDTKEMSPQPVQLTGRLVLRQQSLLRRRQSHLAIIRTRQYVHLSFDACLEVNMLIFNINSPKWNPSIEGSVTLPVLSASPGALNDPTKRCVPP